MNHYLRHPIEPALLPRGLKLGNLEVRAIVAVHTLTNSRLPLNTLELELVAHPRNHPELIQTYRAPLHKLHTRWTAQENELALVAAIARHIYDQNRPSSEPITSTDAASYGPSTEESPPSQQDAQENEAQDAPTPSARAQP